MALVDLVHKDIVKTPLISQNKPEVMRELVTILFNAGKIDDVESVLTAVHAREVKASTGLEAGIAVPHAKTDKVKKLTLAIGISPQGIDFNAMDGKPSHVFFLMLAPLDQSGPHLEALADIAKLTRSRAFCNSMIHAPSAKDIVDLFKLD
jgi:mannitol/fructose-specific phosphotransferase system IIA component (Ntr-type)